MKAVDKVLAWAAILGLTSLLVMLALGILHARVAGIPAFGYRRDGLPHPRGARRVHVHHREGARQVSNGSGWAYLAGHTPGRASDDCPACRVEDVEAAPGGGTMIGRADDQYARLSAAALEAVGYEDDPGDAQAPPIVVTPPIVAFADQPDAEWNDDVEHPAHYTAHPSGVECLEITRHFDFCTGNAIKYLWRAGLKGGAEKRLEDLRKARFYVDDLIRQAEQ